MRRPGLILWPAICGPLLAVLVQIGGAAAMHPCWRWSDQPFVYLWEALWDRRYPLVDWEWSLYLAWFGLILGLLTGLLAWLALGRIRPAEPAARQDG